MKSIMRFNTAWVDGINYYLEIEDAQVPAQSDVTETFRGGGMDSDYDVPLGLEKMAASMMMASLSPALMMRAGLKPGTFTSITFRGSLADEYSDDTTAVICVVEGRISANPKPWKAGAKSGVEYPITSIRYARLTIGDQQIYERSIQGMVNVVGDEDQNAAARRDLGF